MNHRLLLPALLLAASLGACDRPAASRISDATPIPEPTAKTNTLETRRLGSSIDAYENAPTPDHAADVKQAMAALDGEIAELEARVAKTTGGDREEAALKLKNLQTYRDTQAARFTVMRAKGAVTEPTVPADARSGADKAEDSARQIGGKIEDGARRTGDALEDAGRRAKNAIENATH